MAEDECLFTCWGFEPCRIAFRMKWRMLRQQVRSTPNLFALKIETEILLLFAKDCRVKLDPQGNAMNYFSLLKLLSQLIVFLNKKSNFVGTQYQDSKPK